MRFELDRAARARKSIEIELVVARARDSALDERVALHGLDALPEKRVVARQAIVAAAEDTERAEIEQQAGGCGIAQRRTGGAKHCEQRARRRTDADPIGSSLARESKRIDVLRDARMKPLTSLRSNWMRSGMTSHHRDD